MAIFSRDKSPRMPLRKRTQVPLFPRWRHAFCTRFPNSLPAFSTITVFAWTSARTKTASCSRARIRSMVSSAKRKFSRVTKFCGFRGPAWSAGSHRAATISTRLVMDLEAGTSTTTGCGGSARLEGRSSFGSGGGWITLSVVSIVRVSASEGVKMCGSHTSLMVTMRPTFLSCRRKPRRRGTDILGGRVQGISYCRMVFKTSSRKWFGKAALAQPISWTIPMLTQSLSFWVLTVW